MKKAIICTFVFVTVTFAMLLTTSEVYAATSPVENEDVLFYARIEQKTILHTNEWAVIIFYRPPECVPDDFNLLDFFSADAPDCAPLTMDGFKIQSGGPAPSTIQIQLNGLGAVPVWFVAWSEFQTAVTDGVVTMGELEALPSLLVGSASFYRETQNPGRVGQKSPMSNYTAKGLLEDGRSFNVHALLVDDSIINVSIAFFGE